MQAPVILCLVLVDEDLDDVRVCHELAHDEPLRGFVGAHPVLVLAPGHPERHDDIAPAFFDQFLAGNGEILYPRHRYPLNRHTGMFLQFVDSDGSHVDA